MSGRQSAEMREALLLIKCGWSGTEAARATGLHRVTIYKNAEYKALRRKRMRARLDMRRGAA